MERHVLAPQQLKQGLQRPCRRCLSHRLTASSLSKLRPSGHEDSHIHSGDAAQIQPRPVSLLGKRVVVALAAAKHHMVVATSAGELFTWGSNKDGRLGYPAVDTQMTPRK
jgi:hypothetical protein